MFTDKMLQLVGVGILETFYMTLSATALAYLIGLPLGLVPVSYTHLDVYKRQQ